MVQIQYLGNMELLKMQKTAFLASNTISPTTVLRCYDWATEMRDKGECVASGFSSKLERDVLHFLLKGSQPIILVIARRMYKVIPQKLKEALSQERLLIISVSNAVRQSKDTAYLRNEFICEMSDNIVFVNATEKSSLFTLSQKYINKKIEI